MLEMKSAVGILSLKARVAVSILVGCMSMMLFALDCHGQASSAKTGARTISVAAKPKAGFNYPYFLRIPKEVRHENLRLLVEPNNTGIPTDEFVKHESSARKLATSSYATRVADLIQVPLLVPVFPRSKSDWKTYTHALDDDTLKIDEGDTRRIDLQLIAMIADAHGLLRNAGHDVQDEVLMHGFSASGTFANRFVALHPQVVRAVACGGVNSIPILPVKNLGGEELAYPLGIADLPDLVGHHFDVAAFKKVSQYIYMGSFDRNDTTEFRDAFTDQQARLVHSLIGREMPSRWNKCQQVFQQAKIPAQLVTYNSTGHEIRREMVDDIARFFEVNLGEQKNAIEPFQYEERPFERIEAVTVSGLLPRGSIDIPEFARDLFNGKGTFVISVDEWLEGRDYQQLQAFRKLAGFSFRLVSEDGVQEFMIDSSNFSGCVSSGDGKFQGFVVSLDDGFEKLKPDRPYRLIPTNESIGFWKVGNNVALEAPSTKDGRSISSDRKQGSTEQENGILRKQLLGSTAPELEEVVLVNESGGAPTNLKQCLGKVVVMYFWATWCNSCVRKTPQFNQLVKELEGEPIVFLSISNESPDLLRKFLKNHTMDGVVLADPTSKTSDQYGVVSRPDFVIVDRSGKLANIVNFEQLTAKSLREAIEGNYSSFENMPLEDRLASTPSSVPNPNWLVDTRGRDSVERTIFESVLEKSDALGMVPLFEDAELGITSGDGLSVEDFVVICEDTSIFEIDNHYQDSGIRYRFAIKLPPKQWNSQRVKGELKKLLLSAMPDLVVRKEKQLKRCIRLFRSTSDESPKLRETTNQKTGHDFEFGPEISKLEIGNANAKKLTTILGICIGSVEKELGLPVLDETGLDGSFDILPITWKTGDKGSFQEAIKACGLRYELDEHEIEIYVIEKSNKN